MKASLCKRAQTGFKVLRNKIQDLFCGLISLSVFCLYTQYTQLCHAFPSTKIRDFLISVLVMVSNTKYALITPPRYWEVPAEKKNTGTCYQEDNISDSLNKISVIEHVLNNFVTHI